ncbi:uncharacterized protein LOC132611803 [Lycium barbarum]|uniref:uncharacterized protein LOC132611803 n=1 Tax=Lycium barbarum TaxID=112863 RepID=UPI00293E230A|nr:uncharacterized protein LOC132611803 [Lycium barbarum]
MTNTGNQAGGALNNVNAQERDTVTGEVRARNDQNLVSPHGSEHRGNDLPSNDDHEEEEMIPDCRDLRDEVTRLLKKGYLREFLSDRAKNSYGKNKGSNKHFDQAKPSQVINMIIGGTEVAGTPFITKRTKFSVTREMRSRSFVPEEAIIFIDEDAYGVNFPYNDALVISVMIVDTQVKRILIDLGGSANIIRWKVVDQLSTIDKLTPSSRVLNGFNMASETVKGEILLPINVGGILKHTKVYVIDGDMSYNAIFGRP